MIIVLLAMLYIGGLFGAWVFFESADEFFHRDGWQRFCAIAVWPVSLTVVFVAALFNIGMQLYYWNTRQ